MVIEYSTIKTFQDLFSESTDHFLNQFKCVVKPDIKNGMDLPFILSKKYRNDKVNPILQLARPKDARAIVEVYKKIYKGSYPYKEMEDIQEVRRKISEPQYEWLLFRTPTEEIAGCFTYELDFKNKRGYMRGFNIKPQYQGTIDAVKAVVGSMIGIWSQYRGKICHWYCENRTAHTKSQYLSVVCGINPIAFFPNKDVFFGKIESDIMHIAYNSKALTKYRSLQIPKIIPSVKPCFQYSQEKYHLGQCSMVCPSIGLDSTKIKTLKKHIDLTIDRSPFGYETITISLNKSSQFQFLYTPQVQNFEKTKYHVNCREELFVYLTEFKRIIQEWNIRYAESFISAYEPFHQKLFYEHGFRPRGYVPSWYYNPYDGKFEDAIVFNWFKGEMVPPHLIKQGVDLIKRIN
ncbi:MAG: hypothetical protein EU543_02090 [Promethearchaeota archaeon]|nr:MAG: hypothetical protein EU543_02090 [Candidatus Lokiarchaeota archaeon]